MYKIMEEIIDNEKKESALILLVNGELTLKEIASYSGLTLEQVKEMVSIANDISKNYPDSFI